MLNRRPNPSTEYPSRFEVYISRVKSGDIITELTSGKTDTIDFFKSISNEKEDYAYADGKWTIKEVFLHLIDTERIMAYRGLRIARADETPIIGFEQDDYVPASHANHRSMSSLLAEYHTLRDSSIGLYENLSDDMWALTGTAGQNVFSPIASAYVIAGHERHHIEIIKERYL